jgi:predicted RND superfamily exporter protein
MIIILTVVVWSMGTLSLFGYKITMLTGLLPPIIAVIGIPNSIYLLNKYHQEIDRHGNQMRGLSTVISKIGLVTLITNCTTAIGFLVLGFTKITILREFGIVAGINILAAFIVSIIMIPVVFSFLPKPHGKQLKHLKFKGLNFALTGIDLLVHRHRYSVIVVTIGVVVLSVIGFMRLHTVAFMVDDVPEKK